MLTIVALSTPKRCSMLALNKVRAAERLFVQTMDNPCADVLKQEGLAPQSMDDLYCGAESFDELNRSIAERLTACAGDAVYAVPGRGIQGTEQLACILEAAQKKEIAVRCINGTGYADAALSELDAVYEEQLIISSNALGRLDAGKLCAVEEVDTPITAGEVKLALARIYPDDHMIWFATMSGDGEYSLKRMPLCEADRQSAYHASTVIIVPPLRFEQRAGYYAEDLFAVLKRLRAPGGCPWDAKQTHESLKKDLLEETYEVLQTIIDDDNIAMCEELGDLLLQVAFHTLLADEQGEFDFVDVCTGIVQKLVYRHPHVFGDVSVKDADEVLVNWEKLKKTEKSMTTQSDVINAIPKSLPALMYSSKVQKKAADVGFDWEDHRGALEKLDEEITELKDAIRDDSNVAEEMGDTLFAAVNVARLLHLDAEEEARKAAQKFIARFEKMEKLAASRNEKLDEMTLESMDELWKCVKRG